MFLKYTFFILSLFLILHSCSFKKSPYEFFVECEKDFVSVEEIINCANYNLKKTNNFEGRNLLVEDNFIDSIKLLNKMLKLGQISENEAKIQYSILIEKEKLFQKKFRRQNESNYKDYISKGKFYRCFYVDQIFC